MKAQIDVDLLILFGHVVALQILLHVGGGLALFVVDDAVAEPAHSVDFPLALDSLGGLLSGSVIVFCCDFVEVGTEALLDLSGSHVHPQPELQIFDHVLEVVEVHAHDSVVGEDLLELREVGPVFLDVEDDLAPPLDVFAFPGSPLVAVPDLVVAHLLLEAVSGGAVEAVDAVEVGARVGRVVHPLRALVVAGVGSRVEVLRCIHHRPARGTDQSVLVVGRQPTIKTLMHNGRKHPSFMIM